jgi:Na+/melibiose symporter-like transporter
MVSVNLVRAGMLAVLAGAVATEAIDTAIVLAALFLLGAAEVFVDTTANALPPMLVGRDDLGVANARLLFGAITINRLLGPPVGALLFAAGMALPFVTQAVCMVAAAGLVNRIVVSTPVRIDGNASARREIVDGMRWLWRHPAVRTLTLTVVSFNITFGAAWSVLVLYAIERLGLGEVGFGLLTSAGAAGGMLGTMVYGGLERRLGAANIMRGGLIIETLTHLTLALTTSPAVALSVFFVFGMHEAAWGTTATTIRQRVVPTEFQGRVTSVYFVGVFGSLVVGAAIGGVIARTWGITGPFWFGFVGSMVILVSIWRRLAAIAHAA